MYDFALRGGRRDPLPRGGLPRRRCSRRGMQCTEVSKMSEADLYKLFSQYDGEADLSDFTPEELENLLGERKKSEKEKYFEYYDDIKSKSLKKQDW